MRKQLGALMMVAAIVVASSSVARAGSWSVTALGGAAIPMGDFADKALFDAQSGYQIGGSLDYALNNMWTLGVDGSWNKNKAGFEGDTLDIGAPDVEKLDKAEYSTMQVGVHGKYMIPMQGSFHPYTLVGIDMFKTKFKEAGTDTISGVAYPFTGEGESDWRVGGKLGLGGSWSITELLAVGAEANYNFISLDKNKNGGSSSLQYVGATAGLTLKIPMGSSAK